MNEPEHPRQCESCFKFLRRAGWDWEDEDDADEDGRWAVRTWTVTCRSCGATNTHTTTFGFVHRR